MDVQRQFLRIPIEEIGESLVAEVASPPSPVSPTKTGPVSVVSAEPARAAAPDLTAAPADQASTPAAALPKQSIHHELSKATAVSNSPVSAGGTGRLPDTAPTNSVEFELAWRQTQDDVQLQANLLKVASALSSIAVMLVLTTGDLDA